MNKSVSKEYTGKVYLKVKDHTVSGEEFNLIENPEYGFLETHPRPSVIKLPDYYKSEDYISHTNSKRNLFEKGYHFVRYYALKGKLNLINSFVNESKTLLDIGCGTGDFLQTAKNNGWNVFGIEPNVMARNLANNITDGHVYDTHQILEFKKESFDIITLWHVLEHLPDLENQLSVIKKLLKPEGTLIIAVPNYKSYDALHYKSFWAGFDVPRHLWHFSRSAISKLVSKENMWVAKIEPMWFDAFYVSLLSEKYKSGKMNFIKAIFVGLISNIKSWRSKEASSLIYVVKND